MKNTFVVLTLACLIASGPLVGPTDAQPPRPPVPSSKSIAGANNEFGIQLMEKLWQEEPNENLFVSPANINIALVMLLNGCGGTTADEVAAVLGVDAKDLAKLNQAYVDWRDALLDTDPSIELEVANAAFISSQHTVQPDFAKALKHYDARTRQLDFVNDADATKKVNQWCNAVTYGKIPELLPQVDKTTIVLLASAMYLKAQWQSKFKKHLTKDEDFFFLDGTKKPLPTMKQTSDFEYAENSDMQLVRLPYQGAEMAMYVVLPKSNVSVDTLLQKMNARTLAGIMGNASFTDVELHLPRVTLSYKASLNNSLKQMGMKAAFMPGADLSKMVVSRRRAVVPMMVSEVTHKTFLGIDEDGTEAAAVTAITAVGAGVSGPKPKPILMQVNRPFLIFIGDSKTGTVLFCGVIVNP